MCDEVLDGTRCTLAGIHHPQHQAVSAAGVALLWPNPDFRPPLTKVQKKGRTKRMNDLAGAVRPVVVASTSPVVQAGIQEGMATAEAHADPQWKVDALASIRYCAEVNSSFTRTQVWSRLAEVSSSTTHNQAALGPLLLKAVRNGWIENSGEVEMVQETGHRKNYVVIWRSLVRA